MSFFEDVGLLGIASQLKSTSDRFYALADRIYAAKGIELQSRWFPVFRLIHDHGPQIIGDIATAVGQTHSAVSQLASRLVQDEWLISVDDKTDRRRTRLDLSGKAQTQLRKAKPVWRAIRDELEVQCKAAGLDPAATLSGLNTLLDGPIADSIIARATSLGRDMVEIVPFRTDLREHFFRLNADWLQRYFYLEKIDYRVLTNPEREILEQGGAIFFAIVDDVVVGTCALMQARRGEYELTKMAVDPQYQGLGIGRLLIDEAIAEFARRKGKSLFLETNTKLVAAIRLYESIGFEHQPSRKPGSHYQRANVFMIWRPRPKRASAKRVIRPHAGRRHQSSGG
jgi:ribosomal protein S18 acetylase RimI-like enzyme/DNA-binding MarR family transcriptional regulator